MKFTHYLNTLQQAAWQSNSEGLSQSLSIHGGKADKLLVGLGKDADQHNLAGALGSVHDPWGTIGYEHALTLLAMDDGNFEAAYKHQNTLVNAIINHAKSADSWILIPLYEALGDLRWLADAADRAAGALFPNCEDCARTVNKAFTMCATDRTHVGLESKRRGVYKVAGMSMKCYFKVGRPNLCKNVMRAVTSDAGIPPLEDFTMSDRVTWNFYTGMLAFSNGEEDKADQLLTWAFDKCLSTAPGNAERILNYLIPIRLLKGKFPSQVLLSAFPRLQELYEPFLAAMREGNLKAYDEALDWAQRRLVSMHVWMSVEKAREVCLRGLFRITWLACEKSTRIPITSFQTAMSMQGVDVDAAEVECMVANMIYKGYMKGYISHEKQMVVLSKAGAFPSLSARVRPKA